MMSRQWSSVSGTFQPYLRRTHFRLDRARQQLLQHAHVVKRYPPQPFTESDTLDLIHASDIDEDGERNEDQKEPPTTNCSHEGDESDHQLHANTGELDVRA